MTEPPAALTAVAVRVDAQLAGILNAERTRWAELDPALDEPLGDLAELVLGGGKRIRPAYCYWGWVLGGGDTHALRERGSVNTDHLNTDQCSTDHLSTDHLNTDQRSTDHLNTDHLNTGQRNAGQHSADHLGTDQFSTGQRSTVDAAGCALELLHAFALVHDDVMDASPTRRNAPSVWQRFVTRHQQRQWHGEDRRFGEAAAVLVGDMAMVLADRTLGPVPAAARHVWDKLRTELNMGQYLDVAGSARGDVTATQARMIIEHKTAGYTVVRPLQLGAALAGRADLAEGIERHGRPIGTAFQLRDDVLGAFGDPASTGKPVGDDLRENKPTLLMALAWAAATRTQRQVLAASSPEMDDDALAAVQQVLTDTGALAAVEQEITELLDTALNALDSLPDTPDAQEALTALARFVALRES